MSLSRISLSADHVRLRTAPLQETEPVPTPLERRLIHNGFIACVKNGVKCVGAGEVRLRGKEREPVVLCGRRGSGKAVPVTVLESAACAQYRPPKKLKKG